MKKTYQEPSVEVISLVPQDVIASNPSGSIGTASNTLFPPKS